MGRNNHQRIRPGVVVAILGNDERSSFLSSRRSVGGLPRISSWYGGVIKCAGFGSRRILGGDWWGCANRQGRESMVLAALSACFCLLYLAVAQALLLALYCMSAGMGMLSGLAGGSLVHPPPLSRRRRLVELTGLVGETGRTLGT